MKTMRGGALLLLAFMASNALAKDTFVVPRPEIPVATDLKLSNYRAALITDQGRALVLRNDTLQWEFMSAEQLESDHVLQRRSFYTPIESPETTHMFVEDRAIDMDIVTPDSSISKSALGIVTYNYTVADSAPDHSCIGGTSQQTFNLHLIVCTPEGAEVDYYLNNDISVEYSRLFTMYSYNRQKPDPDQGAAHNFRSYGRLANVRFRFNRRTDDGRYNADGVVHAGAPAGGSRAHGSAGTIGFSANPTYTEIVQANYTGLFNLTEEPLIHKAGSGRKAHYSLGIKGSFTDATGTYAYCAVWRMALADHTQYLLSDKNNIRPGAFVEHIVFIDCGIEVKDGIFYPLMVDRVDSSLYPDSMPPIYYALKQNKVSLSIVADKRRSSFVSDTLNNRSYLYLAKGDEWTEIPLGLNDGENVVMLSEAIYELVPAS